MARGMNAPRWLGPLVTAVLRSPLHGGMSRGLLLLTVRGRRTGRAITLPLGYDETSDGWYIVASEPETKSWWRNLSPDRPVTALIRGRSIQVVPEVLRWTEACAEQFESAFARYLRHFGFVANALGIASRDNDFDPACLRAVAQRVVMVRLARLEARTR